MSKLRASIIYLVLQLLAKSSGFYGLASTEHLIRNYASLQQTGFTNLLCHHRRLWAFTPLFSPVPINGSLVSVALSLRLPLVAVSNCLLLCCPDFPPHSSFKILLKNKWGDRTMI